MGNFLIQAFAIVFLIAVGWVGHWAFTSLDTDKAEVATSDAQPQFETDETDLQPGTSTGEPNETNDETSTTEDTTNQSGENEYADLIADIDELRSDQVYMKVGSQGARVGTVQEFLDIYFDADVLVDNDYGNGTSTHVRNFQEAEGLAVDGQAGPSTYEAMIEWLENNG